MKRILINLSTVLVLLFCNTNYANPPGLLFKVTSSGATLTISTVQPNHSYPQAGIKIISPGNTLKNAGTECMPNSNGYCLFSTSDKAPATISINGPSGIMKVVLCLDGLGPTSCQNYTNISVTTMPTKPRYAYIVNGNSANYNVYVCPFALDGVTLLACKDSNLNATTYPTFIYPQGITFNNSGSKAYVTTYANSLTPYTAAWECTVSPSDGTFSSCSPYAVTAPASYTYPEYGMIALNNSNTTSYIVDYNANNVILCPLDSNNDFSSSVCTSSGATTLSSPIGITIESTGTTAYIANSGGGVSICNISGGTFINCVNKTGDGTTTFNYTYGVALNPTETLLYITEPNSNNVFACSTSANISSAFSTCFNANGSNSFTSPYGIVLNRAGTIAYITSYAGPAGNLYQCPIMNDGSFDTCTPYDPGSIFYYPPDITLVY